MPPVAVDYIIGNPLVVNYAAGGNVQQQLQNGYAIDFLSLRLTGTAVLASYSTAPQKFVESIENVVPNFQLQATGRSSGATTDQLCNVDFSYLRTKTRLMEGTDVTRTDIGTANGTYSFETNVRRYFNDPRSTSSALTRIFTSLLTSLTSSFQFGDATRLVTGGTGGTATISAAQVTVQARQYLGMTPPDHSPYVKETQRQYNIQQSTNGYVCDRVPLGNILRRQYIKGLVGTANWNDPSDSIFGATGKPEGPHIQLYINQAVYKLDAIYQQLRDDNKKLFGVEVMPSGYAVYEPSRNKKLATSVPMAGVMQAQNNIDVAYQSGSVNTIQITDEQIVGATLGDWNASK
jgi:hypothetical protein